MLAAVEKGDAQELAELMRQDPGLDVNERQDGYGSTLLHVACYESHRSVVIPLLLAHPDIDVNAKDQNAAWTPFFYPCYSGRTSCVREMLKDFRVKVNEREDDEYTPLSRAAFLATLTSSSGGLRLEGRWISGNLEKGRLMQLGRQTRQRRQKW